MARFLYSAFSDEAADSIDGQIAACKANGMNYSTFMHGLKLAGIDMNRKMLSELAIHDAAAFTALCEKAKASL